MCLWAALQATLSITKGRTGDGKINLYDHAAHNCACGHLALDAALIDTTRNLEGSVVSLIIPRVRDDPMVLAQLGAPAEDLDGVAAQLRTDDVVIHTTGVRREVLIYREGTGDGTVLHHILLDSSSMLKLYDALAFCLSSHCKRAKDWSTVNWSVRGTLQMASHDERRVPASAANKSFLCQCPCSQRRRRRWS